ncbi:MAG TPA: ATP-dependent helicase HrpB, partial [Steroidobacteraceae bacterium]
LAGDLALALCLDAQAQIAPQLRLLVMSATLDTAGVAQLLGDAPLVSAEGRRFTVDTRYLGKGAPLLPGGPESADRAVLLATLRALREESGDVLVFLPGGAEIRRLANALGEALATARDGGAAERRTRVLPLYGDLAAGSQDEAIRPSAAGERKVVLATNIAETSLTIEGVRVVIDTGLVRRAVFDPSTGMSRLETQRISRASSEQRQGRAGRLEAGVCYRLWSEGAQRSLAAFTLPEIAEADLAPLALELAAWGTRDAGELRWLDPPPAAMLASARDLLARLGALDGAGRITAHGRDLNRVAAHPRLAHMLVRAQGLEAEHRGALHLAAQIAALLAERDLLRTSGSQPDADLHARLALLHGERPARVDPGAVQRIRRVAEQFERQIAASRPAAGAGSTAASIEIVGVLAAYAYPDRIARRRAGDAPRYTLANGRGAYFADPQLLGREELLVALDLDDREREARILLAAPLSRADLERYFPERLRRSDEVVWNARAESVDAIRTVRLDALLIEQKPLPDPRADATRAAMLTGLRSLGLAALPWSPESRDLQARMEFVRSLGPAALRSPSPHGWPDVSDAALLARLEAWAGPWLDGITRRSQLTRLPLVGALRGELSHAEQRELEELAPATLLMPSGSRQRIDYLDDNAPCVSVRVQEVFGTPDSPRIGGGRVAVTFKLLSPAQRPLQITRDLASFWRGAYVEVRKDMRGRYPRHYWPENPLEAEPTRRVRRSK